MKASTRLGAALLLIGASAAARAGQYWYLQSARPIGNNEFRCTYYRSAVVNGKYTILHTSNVQDGGCKAKLWSD